MKWYKKVLLENKKTIISSAIFPLIFALVLLVWYFKLGNGFEWRKIEPISAPNLLEGRSFYSALVFRSLGAFLFGLGFYKLLHFLCVIVLSSWRLYKGIKKILWLFLTLIMWDIFPKIIGVLNNILSFIYNILGIILYLLPPLGISLIVSIVIFLLFTKLNYSSAKYKQN